MTAYIPLLADIGPGGFVLETAVCELDTQGVVRRWGAAAERVFGYKAEEVVGRNVFSPADMQNENPSLVGGALGGGTAAAFQQLFLRPIPSLGRADTPVDRLFMASSSAHPGGGVHGAPGSNAARAALARDRALLGDAYRAAINTGNRLIYG